MLFLDADDVIRIARRTIGPDVQIRDAGLIEAAIARPRATVGGQYAHPSLTEMAAALTHSLVTNHAFVDGNKRVGLACLLVFLRLNGRRLTWTNDEAHDVIYRIADGSLRDVNEIARSLDRGTD